MTTATPEMVCAAELGAGVSTRRRFCDVLVSRDPAEGVRLKVPPHRGTATLAFDLHNRHTWSEQVARARGVYARYTTSVIVTTPDGKPIQRAAARAEVRTVRDLFDRVSGGAGPGGVKAVAPAGAERIVITLPERVTELAIVGEKLVVDNLEGRQVYSVPGRPVAIVSNPTVEFRPAPAAASRR
jgi:hypothetical protein